MCNQNQPIDTIDYRGYEVQIFQDFDPMNPCEEFDLLGTMVCSHSQYILGHKQYPDGVESIYETLQELNFDDYVRMDDDYCDMGYNDFIEKYMNKLDDIAIVLPLYLYDHSGITMNTTGFHCPWDSGQVGFIYVTKENIRKEYNKKRISLQLRHKVLDLLKAEVKLYDDFLTGNVYGFNIDDPDTDEHVDSCWGFYGSDMESNGMKEMYTDSIDYHIKNKQIEKAMAIASEVGCACCI